MSNIEVCEPPGQNEMGSVETNELTFSKNLNFCILLSNIRVLTLLLVTTGITKPTSLTSQSRFSYVLSRFPNGSRCLIEEFSSLVFAGVKELLYLLKSAFF